MMETELLALAVERNEQVLVAIYQPPDCGDDFFCCPGNISLILLDLCSKIIMLGDFNLPKLSWLSWRNPRGSPNFQPMPHEGTSETSQRPSDGTGSAGENIHP